MERAVPVTRRSVLVALGVGLVLIALAVILTLSRSPLILAGAGSVRPVTYDSINRETSVRARAMKCCRAARRRSASG